MRNKETGHEKRSRDEDPEEAETANPETSFPRLAYIKVIDLKQAKAMGLIIPSEIALPDSIKFYALHAADGTALGITDTWEAAYAAAVQNDFLPLSVH